MAAFPPALSSETCSCRLLQHRVPLYETHLPSFPLSALEPSQLSRDDQANIQYGEVVEADRKSIEAFRLLILLSLMTKLNIENEKNTVWFTFVEGYYNREEEYQLGTEHQKK